MKRICTVILALMLLVMSQACVFAAPAPETLSVGVEGNTSDLVSITRPENQKGTTFNVSYIVSGYGKVGTLVTLYGYNESEQVYEKLYIKSSYIDQNGVSQVAEAASETEIGTSGLFMAPVPLGQGTNKFLLRAENGGKVQYLVLEITKYNYNIIDLIKSMTA